MKRRICLAWFGDLESSDSLSRNRATSPRAAGAVAPEPTTALPKSRERSAVARRESRKS
ncbi:hypothetical protein OJ996_04620 [Luteolibacter sp. GHJ8]|uniref:Uncharacterized protein n=1 Tax=Luteolibacter rhizosphaerae TaxID=2989719 RepID=A0ABT3FZ51_9BACT|nr:hypothetical protein [Luteolibacter rhizosphaerae]MCW1912843.1 hypothetical protein [Luteolibacter rhizosphaerae]